ncbi:hypothetical protein WJX74_004756 [Apatococcus lobatus]|uniref:CID domain-containing protein n=1 Tax=Apatococcus lobatus TaxID=904363 RepID=A0AAW1RVV8_9CHLO
MASDSVRDFILQYKAELEDLTSNVKVTINTLSQLADEWKRDAAPSVAALLEKRLLNCDPSHKLPALYLLDSIVKNVRQPYISLFARNLPEVFSKVWQSCEGARPQLTKLLGTWQSIFPMDMLAVIQQCIGPALLPSPAHAGSVPAVPVPSHMVAASAPLHVHMPGAAPLGPQSWSFPTANGHAPMQQARASHSPYPCTSYSEPSHHQRWQQQPVSSAQQIHQQLPLPPLQPQLTSRAFQPGPALQQPVALAQPSSAVFNEPDSTASTALALQSLLQAGLLSMPGSDSLLSASQSMLQAPDAHHAVGLESLSPQALKAHNPTVIQSLILLPEDIKAKHRGVLHRQQQRKRKAIEQPTSRHWYADSVSWIKATTVDATRLAQEQQVAEAEEQRRVIPTVPVDDAQRECALSGERFETVWDAESEDWHYLGAVRLSAEEAARYGLAEGMLVLADCLSSSRPEVADDEPAAAAAVFDLPAGASQSQVKFEDGACNAATLSSPSQTGREEKRKHAESLPQDGNQESRPASAAVAAVQTAADGIGTAGRTNIFLNQEPGASLSRFPASEQCGIDDDVSQAAKRVKVEPV